MKALPKTTEYIVLTGGGTAGHILPNLALVPYLEKADWKPVYIGSKSEMELDLVRSMSHLPFYGISTGKLRRYFDLKNISDIFKIIKGLIEAINHLRRIRPVAVFAKGGFVSVPVVWAAWLLHIPSIIHESDLTPGLANRLMMPFAKKICLSFEKSASMVPSQKKVLTGIPVRDFLAKGDPLRGRALCAFSEKGKVLMICGGSQGSKAIDEFVWNHLEQLLSKYLIIHLGRSKACTGTIPVREGYAYFEFVREELPDLYACADIIISRSGANTLFELLYLNKPAILIPLPRSVSRGDQLCNARAFQEKGLMELMLQEKLEINALMNLLDHIEKNAQNYKQKMKASQKQEAGELIVNVISKEVKSR